MKFIFCLWSLLAIHSSAHAGFLAEQCRFALGVFTGFIEDHAPSLERVSDEQFLREIRETAEIKYKRNSAYGKVGSLTGIYPPTDVKALSLWYRKTLQKIDSESLYVSAVLAGAAQDSRNKTVIPFLRQLQLKQSFPWPRQNFHGEIFYLVFRKHKQAPVGLLRLGTQPPPLHNLDAEFILAEEIYLFTDESASLIRQRTGSMARGLM